MSSDRIAELHERASEHYLNGDYAGALRAWRDILAIDPDNGPAQDGAQLAAQFVENPDEGRSTDGGAEIDSALERKLAPKGDDHGLVFESREEGNPGDRRPVQSRATDVSRQGEGIDFGDLSGETVIPLGTTSAPDASPQESLPDGWESTAAPSEEASYELEPAMPAARVPDNPALQELHRRVDDLIAQARVKAESGEREEALAILNRVAILDEENAQAAALRKSLESSKATDLETIERGIVEGVAALEAENLDEAEARFQSVLTLSPEHREAAHYLDVIRSRRASSGGPARQSSHDDLLGSGDLLGDLPPADPSAPSGAPAAAPGSSAAPLAKSSDERPIALDRPVAVPRAPTVPAPARSFAISPAALALIGAGVILLGGAWAWVHFVSGARPPAAAPVLPPRPANVKASAPPAPKAAPAPMTPEDRAKAVVAALAKGRAEMAGGNYSAAVVAFNSALGLDPTNADARTGLHDAGERFRAQQAERTALDGIRLAFRDGEYTSGLRMAYRLPATVPTERVEAIKAAGWYDLAIVALRAGDCKAASSNLDEVLAIEPKDDDAQRLKEFAKLYLEAPKDRKFLDIVEALKFRDPPQ